MPEVDFSLGKGGIRRGKNWSVLAEWGSKRHSWKMIGFELAGSQRNTHKQHKIYWNTKVRRPWGVSKNFAPHERLAGELIEIIFGAVSIDSGGGGMSLENLWNLTIPVFSTQYVESWIVNIVKKVISYMIEDNHTLSWGVCHDLLKSWITRN